MEQFKTLVNQLEKLWEQYPPNPEYPERQYIHPGLGRDALEQRIEEAGVSLPESWKHLLEQVNGFSIGGNEFSGLDALLNDEFEDIVHEVQMEDGEFEENDDEYDQIEGEPQDSKAFKWLLSSSSGISCAFYVLCDRGEYEDLIWFGNNGTFHRLGPLEAFLEQFLQNGPAYFDQCQNEMDEGML